tara:strand:+ start:143 stop:364 length:222 start_codon:yes stop_codon:yes gene_type:complete
MEYLNFAQWVNKNGQVLCELYDQFIDETNTCPFEVSILDFEEEMYRQTTHYLNVDEVDCDVNKISKSNGGLMQ